MDGGRRNAQNEDNQQTDLLCKGSDDNDLYIIGRFCLSVTFLLIYGSRSVFMGIHGSRLVIHSSRLVLMVFIGSRLVFHVSRLVVHGFS